MVKGVEMNKALKRLGVIVFFIILLISLVIWTSYRHQFPRTYIIDVDAATRLTQENALSVTKQALFKAGLDIKIVLPQHYKADDLYGPNETEKFFSRNPNDPNNSGYVIWKSQDEGIYKVGIEKSENKIKCKISVIKPGKPNRTA